MHVLKQRRHSSTKGHKAIAVSLRVFVSPLFKKKASITYKTEASKYRAKVGRCE